MYVFLFIYWDFGEVLLLEDHPLESEVKSNLFLYMKVLKFATNSDILIALSVKSNVVDF